MRQLPIDSLPAGHGCIQASLAFWRDRLHYFKNGLYYQGGMVSPPLPSYLLALAALPLHDDVCSMASCGTGESESDSAALMNDFVCRVQGQVVWLFQILMRLIGLGGVVTRVATAPTLEDQRTAWEAAWPVRLLHQQRVCMPVSSPEHCRAREGLLSDDPLMLFRLSTGAPAAEGAHVAGASARQPDQPAVLQQIRALVSSALLTSWLADVNAMMLL